MTESLLTERILHSCDLEVFFSTNTILKVNFIKQLVFYILNKIVTFGLPVWVVGLDAITHYRLVEVDSDALSRIIVVRRLWDESLAVYIARPYPA